MANERPPHPAETRNDSEGLRHRAAAPRPLARAEVSAAECLLRALRATTPEERDHHASLGLLAEAEDDREMTALLLRQRYLAEFASGRFEEARTTANEVVALEELGDVARQDAARAALAVGALDEAVEHLRIATRVCPPTRRSFHFATLGAYLRFGGRLDEAIVAFEKAVRFATKERPFYRAQQALAEVALGRPPHKDLSVLREELEGLESERGYRLWILGELCSLLGDEAASRRYLTAFVERVHAAPLEKSVALAGELRRAEEILARRSA